MDLDYYTNLSFWFNLVCIALASAMHILRRLPTISASLAMVACVNAALVGLMGSVVLCLHESCSRKTMMNNAVAHALPLFVAAVLLRRWPWAQPDLCLTVGILLCFGLGYMCVPDSAGKVGLDKIARAYKFRRPMPWFAGMLGAGVGIAYVLR